jgi:hypothetical protein
MACQTHAARRYRVWIVRSRRPPENWRQLPAAAAAVEPAEQRSMNARRARVYVEAFNGVSSAADRDHWAVAVPVRLRYDGDLPPGEIIAQRA